MSSHRSILVSIALGAIVLVPLAASAAPRSPDTIKPWSESAVDLREITVLPIVQFVDRPILAQHIEARWLELFRDSGYQWQGTTPDLIASAGAIEWAGYSERIANQVRRSGRVDSVTAIAVTRLLHTPAILSLRIDRFEHKNDRTMIELTASVVDSTGRLIWSIAGASGSGSGADIHSVSPEQWQALELLRRNEPARYLASSGEEESGSVYRSEMVFPPSIAPLQSERALYGLFARWSHHLPQHVTTSTELPVATR